MTRLDERLRRELELAGRPADPTGVYEELIRRRERRRLARRLEAGALALAVSAASLVGIWAVTRSGDGGAPATPGSEGTLAAVLYREPRSFDLALIAADGSVRSLLSPEPDGGTGRIVGAPAWSPDGTSIAFWLVQDPEARPEEPSGLYAIDLRDGELRLVLETPLSIWDIAWSPDGRRIAFLGADPRQGGTELEMPASIYTVAPDGSDLQQLPIEGPVRELDWSPDGSRLVISRLAADPFEDRLEGRLGQDLFAVDLETGAETRLTEDGRSWDPAWSPDGSQIAFVSGSPRLHALFVVGADGSDRRRLTDPDGTDGSPTWSPDGEWIAVTRRVATATGTSGALGPSGAVGVSGSLGASTCQVVLVAADGSGERVLLDGPIDGACATELAWRPAPTAPATGEPTAATSPSPTGPSPTPTTSPAAGPDLAAGCGLSALEGDYDGDGAPDVAVVSTLPRDGGCPEPGKGATYLGIGFGQTEQDVGAGAFLADLTFGPIDCGAGVGCRVFAAPDLDGDGAAELAVVQDTGASVEILGLYRVESCGPAADCPAASWISPIVVADPGDPELGLDPGPARIVWGGSVLQSFGAYCGAMEGDPPTDETGFVVWRASAPAEGSGSTVHEALFRLRGTRLLLVATHDYEAPSTTAGLPPGGADLCGAPVAGSSGD